MSLDLSKYYRHFDEFDLSKAERDDYIRHIFGVLENLIDSMIGTHPATQALVDKTQTCTSKGDTATPDMVDCKQSILTEMFEDVAKLPNQK